MISVSEVNLAFNALSQPWCSTPFFVGVTSGASSVKSTSFVGFTQYLVVSVSAIVPCFPALNSTNTKFAGTFGLSSPGFCGTMSSEYLAVNVVSETSPVLSANLVLPSNHPAKVFVSCVGFPRPSKLASFQSVPLRTS